MATPKEQHDARELIRQRRLTARERDGQESAEELPRSQAAPLGAESQGDGQPENELELHDHSSGAEGQREGK